MTTLQALILGMIQGLTEFLPVSSSGHLVIFQHLFAISEPPLTFDILVHLGTLVAVFVAFWPDIYGILRRPFTRLTYLILVGIIPAGLAGYLLAPYFEKAFDSLMVVGLGLIFTGFILKWSEAISRRIIFYKDSDDTRYREALFIGLWQALAILPGISRSGSTIAAGLIAGLDRQFAAHYSFLLSIPVILGAAVFELKDLNTSMLSANLLPYIVGPLTAAVFGYLAIKVVLRLVNRGNLSIFSYYCWALAAFTLIWAFIAGA